MTNKTPPADDVREACQQPPVGWHCSREAGHDGPCAARPIGQHDHKWEVHQGWAKCTLCGLEDEDPKWEPSRSARTGRSPRPHGTVTDPTLFPMTWQTSLS